MVPEQSWRACIDGRFALHKEAGAGLIENKNVLDNNGLFWLANVDLSLKQLQRPIGSQEFGVVAQIEPGTYCVQQMSVPKFADLVQASPGVYTFADPAADPWLAELLANLRIILPKGSLVYFVLQLWPLKLLQLQ